MTLIQVGDHILNGQGLPARHVAADTEESARDLANAMARSGYYPAGLSPCFTSGINGDWADYGGICPFWTEAGCDCPEDMPGEFRELLGDMGIPEADWHGMTNAEKREAVEEA